MYYVDGVEYESVYDVAETISDSLRSEKLFEAFLDGTYPEIEIGGNPYKYSDVYLEMDYDGFQVDMAMYYEDIEDDIIEAIEAAEREGKDAIDFFSIIIKIEKEND